MDSKLKITQIKSAIGKPKTQRETIKALGIRKLNQSVIHLKTPQIKGMLNRIKHLIKVEEVE
jgi:large subunit ribosomal protein L30